jgi:hypothetical protein
MDLVNSLFGLPPQEQLRQQQLSRDVGLGGLFAAATVNPYAAPAVQDAYLKQQQAQFALGSMGARGLGSLFGFKDPELQRVSTLEGILQGVSEEVDINNPVQFYPTLQKRLQQAGFSQEATQVGMAGQEAIQNFAKSQSEIEAQKAMASQRTAQAKQIEADLESIPAKVEFVKENIKGISDDQAKAIAMDPVAIRELLKPERLGTPENQAEQVILNGFKAQFPDNPVKAAEEFAKWKIDSKAKVAAAGAPKNIFDKGSSAYGASVGKLKAEADDNLINLVETAGDRIGKIEQALALVGSPDAITGILSDYRLDFARIISGLGGVEAAKRVESTQLLDSLLGSDVFPQIQALGIGARGLDTPAEREFLQRVITGDISMDASTIKRMLEIRKNIETRMIDRYNSKLEKGDFKLYEKALGTKLNPVYNPSIVIINGQKYDIPSNLSQAQRQKYIDAIKARNN